MIKINSGNVHAPGLIEAGILTSKKNQPLQNRLEEIYKNLVKILEEFSPNVLAIEEIYSVKTFPRSSIFIGNVQGIVLLAAAQKKLPVASYYPIQVKKALVGYGRAKKIQTQKCVQRTLNLKEVPRPDDVADALAVALCHANRVRF